MARGAARRHLHPPAGAHVARLPRARARRRRRPVPRRDELARLRHARGPRPADGAARGRRPERPARARDRAALVDVRLRRRRSVRVPRRARRPVGRRAPRRPSRSRPTIRSPRRCGTSASCTGSAPGSTPSELLERIVRERHVLEVGADGGRFRDVARRVRFVVDQARAFGDAAGGIAARLPRVGDAAGRRRRAGRRDRAARDRRRRRADHDDPRRQGARVPDRRSARA